MKLTRWKRRYPNIIGKRFFDGGEYGLGYFTVLRAYSSKEHCKNAIAPDGTHVFDKAMIVVKTDSGYKFKIPYCPWLNVVDAETGKLWSSYFNEKPW